VKVEVLKMKIMGNVELTTQELLQKFLTCL